MTSTEFFRLFTYTANWDIQLNLLFLLGAIVYLLITGPFSFLIKGSEPVKLRTKLSFLIGWTIYYLAMGSPLVLLAHELFSMHMLQMSLLYIVMPPLLLLGMPGWLIRPIIQIKWIKKIVQFFTRPLVSLFLFNGLISLYHVPVVFDAIMKEMIYHNISHFILLVMAIFMWWPILCPISEMDYLKPLRKLGLIFANGVLLTPACALIIFADHVLFNSYAEMSQLVPIMSPRDDQQLGGVIMKIIQEIVYISAIGAIFIQWIRLQKEKDKEDLVAMKNYRDQSMDSMDFRETENDHPSSAI
ncbi:putative membrane protein [Seinonella peptonophila]|uniref:Putative membrane protein n=1 Tax=Seinonella peptonophila TaxID=112248 RepID=A0A1M4SZ26_9BACL|nr:cytochrome c oxidase assembly protein [Seinonella peptonophila]SHE37445.1 putative membrane protein [Seinonella peptonophila]